MKTQGTLLRRCSVLVVCGLWCCLPVQGQSVPEYPRTPWGGYPYPASYDAEIADPDVHRVLFENENIMFIERPPGQLVRVLQLAVPAFGVRLRGEQQVFREPSLPIAAEAHSAICGALPLRKANLYLFRNRSSCSSLRALQEGIQHIPFHFQICGEITAGRSHRGVTEIIANDRETDTRLQQGHSAAVAEGVGRHASVPEIRHLSGRALVAGAEHGGAGARLIGADFVVGVFRDGVEVRR